MVRNWLLEKSYLAVSPQVGAELIYEIAFLCGGLRGIGSLSAPAASLRNKTHGT